MPLSRPGLAASLRQADGNGDEATDGDTREDVLAVLPRPHEQREQLLLRADGVAGHAAHRQRRVAALTYPSFTHFRRAKIMSFAIALIFVKRREFIVNLLAIQRRRACPVARQAFWSMV